MFICFCHSAMGFHWFGHLLLFCWDALWIYLWFWWVQFLFSIKRTCLSMLWRAGWKDTYSFNCSWLWKNFILLCWVCYCVIPSFLLSFLPSSLPPFRPPLLSSLLLSFSSFHFFSPFPPSLYFLSFCPSLFLPFLLSFIPTAY